MESNKDFVYYRKWNMEAVTQIVLLWRDHVPFPCEALLHYFRLIKIALPFYCSGDLC